MKRSIVLAFLSALAMALSACSTPAAPTPALYSAPIEISAISPAKGTVLSTGTTVSISLTVVSYVASPGRVTLSLQDQAHVPLLASTPAANIAPRGEATLGASFVVPAGASSIDVIVGSTFADPHQIGVGFLVTYSVR